MSIALQPPVGARPEAVARSARCACPSRTASTTTISRCSSRTPTSSISPPAMPHAMSSVPASTRSAMISLSAGPSSSTPSISIVDGPRAQHVRAHAVEERREVGDLRLARRVLDHRGALGEHRRAHEVLGRADARELEHARARRAAASRARARSRARPRPRAPIASSPRRCMSTLRLPMLSPPGSATRASPHRASNGPSTLNDARIRVTSSYGASGCERRPTRRSARRSVRAARPRAPTARSRSIITSRSRTGGMLRSVVTPGASSAAAICFTPEFLVAPDGCTRPSSGPLARTRKRVTAKRLLTRVVGLALLHERR